MAEHINIGDTVDVNAPNFGGTWRGEVMSFSPMNLTTMARVRCVRPPDGDIGPLALRAGDEAVVAVEFLTRAGDPDGMRADGCDDVDVTGHVRPMHRHAVTGKAHAHPSGELAHTHQTPEQVAQMSAAATAAELQHIGEMTAEAGRRLVRAAGLEPASPGPTAWSIRAASLLVRQAMALSDEGIGPEAPEPSDGDTLDEAVRLVRRLFVDHELWDHGLIDDSQHPADGCDRCEFRRTTGVRP